MLEELVRNEDIIITLSDARAFFNGCPTGWQTLCDQHNLDWKTVVKKGMKASELLSLNDFMTTSLVEFMYKDKLHG